MSGGVSGSAALVIARIKAGDEPVPLPLAAKLAGGAAPTTTAGLGTDHAARRSAPLTSPARVRHRRAVGGIMPPLGPAAPPAPGSTGARLSTPRTAPPPARTGVASSAARAAPARPAADPAAAAMPEAARPPQVDRLRNKALRAVASQGGNCRSGNRPLAVQLACRSMVCSRIRGEENTVGKCTRHWSPSRAVMRRLETMSR